MKSITNIVLMLSIWWLTSFSLYAESTKNVLIIKGHATMFSEVEKGIYDDLEGEVTFSTLSISKKSKVKDLKQHMVKFQPDIIILMGNKAVNLYADYQALDLSKNYPPAVAVAALFIDQVNTGLKNVTAIRYEIPAVIGAVSIRSILQKPVKKIGVVYREWMTEMIEENRRYCAQEGIELVSIQLPNKMKNVSKKVKRALNTLSSEVDVMWILNDNGLLTKDAIVKAWLPDRAKSRLPAIVGIKQFITKIPLGAFAVVPDNYGLGAQTAEMVFEIMDNNWQLDEVKVHQPLSVKKFLNAKSLDNRGIRIKEERLGQMDEIIEKQ